MDGSYKMEKTEATEFNERKAKKLQEKTDYVRREFNLPDSEDVIQDYFCLWGATKGRLYITGNHLCWASSITSTTEKIPFRKVTLIKAAKTFGLVGSAIDISTAGDTYHFSSFVHREETLNLLMHLWRYPPSFISITKSQSPPTQRRLTGASMGSAGLGGGPSSADGSAPSSGSPAWRHNSAASNGTHKSRATVGAGVWSSDTSFNSSTKQGWDSSVAGAWFGGEEQGVTAEMVDTKTSENALRLALEAREMGVDTITDLELQAEQIDRIESDVENIHTNLDKGDRLLRGVESFGGYLKNKFSNPTQIHGTSRAVERKIEWQKKRPEKIEIPILIKHASDNLTPATMLIETEQFSVLNEGMKKIRGMSWQYEDVNEIVVRSRPLHLDLRFGTKSPRFRLVSSFIQPIVNEFFFRCPEAKVVFEPCLCHFEYGSDRIQVSTVSRAQGGGAFFSVKKSTADLLSDEVPVEVKMAVRKQDEDLDQISYLVGEMGQMGIAMGVELERQTEQLGRVTNKVEYANERLHNANNRIERQL